MTVTALVLPAPEWYTLTKWRRVADQFGRSRRYNGRQGGRARGGRGDFPNSPNSHPGNFRSGKPRDGPRQRGQLYEWYSGGGAGRRAASRPVDAACWRNTALSARRQYIKVLAIESLGLTMDEVLKVGRNYVRRPKIGGFFLYCVNEALKRVDNRAKEASIK